MTQMTAENFLIFMVTIFDISGIRYNIPALTEYWLHFD